MSRPIQTILVAVDFSTGSRAALDQASRIAIQHGAKLHVLHVIDRDALAALADSRKEPFESAVTHATDGGHKALNQWLAQSKLPAAFEITLVVGAPLHEILEHVKSLKADMLVAGIAGSGENAAGAGSVSGKLARKSSVDVLLVRADQPQPFQKIVACVDFSEHSHRVVELAREIAVQDSASVDFLHVWKDPGSMLPVMGPFGESGLSMVNLSVSPHEELLHAIQAQLHDFVKDTSQGVNAHEVLHEDRNLGRGIADHAEKAAADLIILGALGRTNLRYLLLGSTAERVLTRLPCSVLVVKPPHE